MGNCVVRILDHGTPEIERATEFPNMLCGPHSTFSPRRSAADARVPLFITAPEGQAADQTDLLPHDGDGRTQRTVRPQPGERNLATEVQLGTAGGKPRPIPEDGWLSPCAAGAVEVLWQD
jgi:hypothetical protein